jgi:hypothetical protein
MQHQPPYIGVQEYLLTTVTLEDELAEQEKQSAPPPHPPPGLRFNSFRFMFSDYVEEVSMVPSECLKNWTMSVNSHIIDASFESTDMHTLSVVWNETDYRFEVRKNTDNFHNEMR